MKILILHVQIILRNQKFRHLCVDMLDDSLSVNRFVESSYIETPGCRTVIGFPRFVYSLVRHHTHLSPCGLGALRLSGFYWANAQKNLFKGAGRNCCECSI